MVSRTTLYVCIFSDLIKLWVVFFVCRHVLNFSWIMVNVLLCSLCVLHPSRFWFVLVILLSCFWYVRFRFWFVLINSGFVAGLSVLNL